MTKRILLLALLLPALLSLPALATTLTFDIFNPVLYPSTGDFPEGYLVSQEYGDRVTSTSTTLGDYTFEYLIGAEGATPNVTAEYGPYSIFTSGPELWRDDFGDLARVLYQGSRPTFDDQGQPIGNDYDWLLVVLHADPGYEVLLHGFDLGGWNQTDREIQRLAVFGSYVTGPDLPTIAAFEELNATVAGAGPNHSSYSFSTPIRGSAISILIDARNLGEDSTNVGIDNIRFSQEIAAVPEPATFSMMLAGAALLLARRYRRRVAA